MRTIIAVLIVVFVVGPFSAEAELEGIIERCCNMGKQWYVQSREQCTSYPRPVRGVDAEDQENCAAVADICCLGEKEDKQCQRGKQFAVLPNGCAGLQSQSGNEDARECCNCCFLGKNVKELGLSCNIANRFNNQCQEAFRECCNAATARPADNRYSSTDQRRRDQYNTDMYNRNRGTDQRNQYNTDTRTTDTTRRGDINSRDSTYTDQRRNQYNTDMYSRSSGTDQRQPTYPSQRPQGRDGQVGILGVDC